MQRDLSEALAKLKPKGSDPLPAEGEPGEEVETVDRGGAPATAYPWAVFETKSWPEEAEPGP